MTHRIKLASTPADCKRLTGIVRRFQLENSVDQTQLMSELRLVIEEILINIIQHGYRGANDREIEVELALRDNSLSMRFTDIAPAFNPLPFEMDANDDHSEGGMGMQLVKSLTDSQHYKRENGRNVFAVTKKLY